MLTTIPCHPLCVSSETRLQDVHVSLEAPCASWTRNLLSTGRHGDGRDDGFSEIFLRRAERKCALTSPARNSRKFADAEEREARILSPPSVGQETESEEVGRCCSRTRAL
jgi:hypothetical protein